MFKKLIENVKNTSRTAISKVKAYRNEFDFYTALCVEQLTGVKSGQGVTFKLNDF